MRCASWWFERVGVDVALAGDLEEERARGRSGLWYGRQVLIAIAIGIWRSVFDHKTLAVRALATGCAANAVWVFLWSKFVPIGPSRPVTSLETIATLSMVLCTQVVTGWIVARTHRAQALPMALLFAVWLMAWYVGTTFPEGRRLLVNSIDQPRFRAYFAWYLLPVCMEVVGLVMGGVIGAGRFRGQEGAERSTAPPSGG